MRRNGLKWSEPGRFCAFDLVIFFLARQRRAIFFQIDSTPQSKIGVNYTRVRKNNTLNSITLQRQPSLYYRMTTSSHYNTPQHYHDNFTRNFTRLHYIPLHSTTPLSTKAHNTAQQPLHYMTSTLHFHISSPDFFIVHSTTPQLELQIFTPLRFIPPHCIPSTTLNYIE